MKGLNISKFKKVAENKDWATLMHKDGHTINIAKPPLSHLQRKQLEHLKMHKGYANGGKVELSPAVSSNEKESNNPQALRAHEQHLDEMSNAVPTPVPFTEYARGGKVMGYDDGGSVAPEPNSTPLPEYLKEPQAPAQQQPQDDGSSALSDEAAQETPDASAPPQAQAPQVVQQDPQQQAVGSPVSGLQQQMAGTDALAAAQQQEASNKTVAYNTLETQLKALPTPQDIIKSHQDADARFEKEYREAKIDPKAYWTNHSPIAAGLGVLISSIGQAIGQGHVPSNVSLDIINKGIEREIDAQKANKEGTMNLWRMNRQALGNDLSANLATQSQLLNLGKLQIDKYAAQAQGPKDKAAAQIAKGKLQSEIDLIHLKQAALSPTSMGPAEQLGLQSRLGLNTPDEAKEIAHEGNLAENIKGAAPGIFDGQMAAAGDSRPSAGGFFGTSPKTFLPGHLPLIGDLNTKTPGQKAFLGRITPTAQDATGSVKTAETQSIDENQNPGLGDTDQTAYGDKPWTTINYLANKSAANFSKSKNIDWSRDPRYNVTREGLIQLWKSKFPDKVKYLDAAINANPSGAPGIRTPAAQPETMDRIGKDGKTYTYKLNPKTGKYE